MVKVVEFLKEVRQEVSKVTWSTPKEVATSTVVVIVLVAVAALFFLLVDTVIYNGINLLLGL